MEDVSLRLSQYPYLAIDRWRRRVDDVGGLMWLSLFCRGGAASEEKVDVVVAAFARGSDGNEDLMPQ